MYITSLDPERDRGRVERLWLRSLPRGWPLLPRGLDLLTSGVIAEEDGHLIGLAARSGRAIQIVIVAPSHRRAGVGTALFQAARRMARAERHSVLTLGSGGEGYIWPGVPVEAHGAIAFFESLGYRWEYTATDLVLHLKGWAPPPGAAGVASFARVRTGPALDAAAVGEVVAFERQWFPTWVRHFEAGRESILAARSATDVVGALLFAPSGSLYEPALSVPCASIGCVGVRPDQRGRGVATAMLLDATRIVRDQGADSCHIGWAWRERLYERAGYSPWRRYLIGAPLAIDGT